jgi:uncharacterized membrane protein YphA (DoxX/SURF4 family)
VFGRRRESEEGLLLGWFSGFPGGRSGFALLILRGVPGLILVGQGLLYFRGTRPFSEMPCALSAIIAGLLLTIGLITPVVAFLVVLSAAGVALALLPLCAPYLFDSRVSETFALANLLAVLLLGPGAFSIDARLFGRREIIIPPSHGR